MRARRGEGGVASGDDGRRDQHATVAVADCTIGTSFAVQRPKMTALLTQPPSPASLGAPEHRHPSTWLPFDYQRVPGPIRFWLSRRLLGRGVASVSPEVAFARDQPLAAGEAVSWPLSARAALGLSHDLDTARALDPTERLLDLEERLGVRSTLFLPGELAEQHAARVRGWQARGFELGLHDVRHDNRLPDLDAAALADRLARIAATAAAFEMRGFRAPSFWIRAPIIERLPAPLAYDSSLPSLRAGTHAGRVAGAGTCRPFRVGRLWELPVSLPVDDDLLRAGLRGDAGRAVLAGWLAAVQARGGVAVYVDHQEPHLSGNARARAALEALLRGHASAGELWIAPLGAIARHLGFPAPANAE